MSEAYMSLRTVWLKLTVLVVEALTRTSLSNIVELFKAKADFIAVKLVSGYYFTILDIWSSY